jgi:hypothetical protein
MRERSLSAVQIANILRSSKTKLGNDKEKLRMTKTGVALLALALSVTPAVAQGQTDAREALIARAKSLELNVSYVPPPGDAIEHYASGYAKIMCSAVFTTGLDPAFAAESVGFHGALCGARETRHAQDRP